MRLFTVSIRLTVFFLFYLTVGNCGTIDLSKARIATTVTDKEILRRTVEILQQEVQKRSGVQLPVMTKIPTDKQPFIGLLLDGNLDQLPADVRAKIQAIPESKNEGFKLVTIDAANVVLIVGHDARGLLYGVGRLLRKLDMKTR